MDPATNSCKGYGFVDFDSAPAAEAAMKSLQANGVQAQMAKVWHDQQSGFKNL